MIWLNYKYFIIPLRFKIILIKRTKINNFNLVKICVDFGSTDFILYTKGRKYSWWRFCLHFCFPISNSILQFQIDLCLYFYFPISNCSLFLFSNFKSILVCILQFEIDHCSLFCFPISNQSLFLFLFSNFKSIFVSISVFQYQINLCFHFYFPIKSKLTRFELIECVEKLVMDDEFIEQYFASLQQ